MLAAARQRRNEAGFTLIELMIVVVIVGVLSSLAVSSVGGMVHLGKNAACGADKTAVNLAGVGYVVQNGSPAASIDALVAAGLLQSNPLDVLYTPTATSFTVIGLAPCAA